MSNLPISEKYRIIRSDSHNIAIQKLIGDPDKQNWGTISYHGNSASSLVAGLFNVIMSEHAPVGDELAEQAETLRCALVSAVTEVEKMVKEAKIG